MPITPFLRDQAFDPETIEAMSEAFAPAREILGLKDREDPLTALVARRIIELAQRGVRTKAGLCSEAVKKFTANPQ